MIPFNRDPPYEIFNVTATYSQRVTNLVICYDTDIIVTSRVIIVALVCCRCGFTAFCWVTDMCLLRLFLSG